MARRKPPTGPQVEEVLVEDARELFTFQAKPEHWTPEWIADAPDRALFRGAIVRLRPPMGVTDEDVADVRKAFERAGARRVFTLPRPRVKLLPENRREEETPPPGAREAVLQVVAESASGDRDALLSLCEAVMAEVGL